MARLVNATDCPTCHDQGRNGYCAPRRCYCHHTDCPAYPTDPRAWPTQPIGGDDADPD